MVSHQSSVVRGTSSRLPFQVSAFQRFSVSAFVFPICFFLTAVPWPTFIEGPLIQGLMRANIGVTIELLGVIGVPAIQHGNVIEVATGMVGIDEACSGIRSFQASLMISLFLGELCALSARRRALCVVAGFALAFNFNAARTLLLTRIAAAKGIGAMGSWHDPAGVVILLACFISLWLIARAMRKGEKSKVQGLKSKVGTADVDSSDGPYFSSESSATLRSATADGGKSKVQGLKSKVQGLESEVLSLKSEVPRPESKVLSTITSQPHQLPRRPVVPLSVVSRSLCVWLVLVEVGTELWYRSHEWRVPKSATWHMEPPRENPTFRELPFSDKTKQLLRYDEALNGTWQEGGDQRWQGWNPGRIAVHLAKNHTPEVCLTAAGGEVVPKSGLRLLPVHGLQLPFRSYVVKDNNGPVHVFYCLWDDRAEAQFFRTTSMTYANRLAPVLDGHRNSGQRSLEVLISGIPDQQEAEAALGRELEELIKVDR
ncbi:MAG: exosortase/archaeosortase family protein [Verrucomicrobia bacterium]|nr:exosortase/archaeosortase family protein [Verrucomicrobiota bacterium]